MSPAPASALEVLNQSLTLASCAGNCESEANLTESSTPSNIMAYPAVPVVDNMRGMACTASSGNDTVGTWYLSSVLPLRSATAPDTRSVVVPSASPASLSKLQKATRSAATVESPAIRRLALLSCTSGCVSALDQMRTAPISPSKRSPAFGPKVITEGSPMASEVIPRALRLATSSPSTKTSRPVYLPSSSTTYTAATWCQRLVSSDAFLRVGSSSYGQATSTGNDTPISSASTLREVTAVDTMEVTAVVRLSKRTHASKVKAPEKCSAWAASTTTGCAPSRPNLSASLPYTNMCTVASSVASASAWVCGSASSIATNPNVVRGKPLAFAGGTYTTLPAGSVTTVDVALNAVTPSAWYRTPTVGREVTT
mmetsp:Transcript_35052/g.58952  ORF Transcript_35052/g.58952 Transcript_35052/m.58952 type:complete len:369 (-) Transcript_35052:8124-9230(-)